MDRDRDLVEAAQRGDQAAFVDLVRSTGDRFFALAYRMLRDVDRAEDALQDALVIAWRDLQDAPRSGPFRRMDAPRRHQRLYRQRDARASSHSEPACPAGRGSGGAG